MYEEDDIGAQPAKDSEDSENDDSVSASEEAFMRGYEEAGNEEEPEDEDDSEEESE